MLPNYEEILRESLRDWFKKEDWVRKKAQSLTKAERKATVAKKVRGSKKGKQFVKNTKKSEFKKKK
jgi:hypothetical protein